MGWGGRKGWREEEREGEKKREDDKEIGPQHVASFPGHSQILSHSHGEKSGSPRLRDKIWEWPGNKATQH